MNLKLDGYFAWGPNDVSCDVLEAQSLGQQLLRAFSYSEYRSHPNLLFIKCNQHQISDLSNNNIGIFMHKYCNNLLPFSFNSMFKNNAKNQNYTKKALNF